MIKNYFFDVQTYHILKNYLKQKHLFLKIVLCLHRNKKNETYNLN